MSDSTLEVLTAKVLIIATPDYSLWPEDDLRWQAGWQEGIKIPVKSEDVMSTLEYMAKQGFSCEVKYPDK